MTTPANIRDITCASDADAERMANTMENDIIVYERVWANVILCFSMRDFCMYFMITW